MRAKPRSLIASLFLTLAVIMGIRVQIRAQSDGADWASPTNLSQSGAASSPVIVTRPDGTLRILWWDEFDGLLVSDGVVSAPQPPDAATAESMADQGWSAPEAAPILLPKMMTRNGQLQSVLVPIESMPHIVGDTAGRAHAFWLGAPDEATGDRALLYSRLSPSGISWSTPVSLVSSAAGFDATADTTGAVHVAYVQPTQVGRSPSGLYYRQARNGGAWSTPVAIQQSQYLRHLPADEGSIRLTADDSESVYATWQDPRTDQVLLAHSADGGATWQEPRPFTSTDGAPLQNQVVALPGGPASVLWKPAGEGQGSITLSSTDDVLTLSVWDGARWTETKPLSLRFTDPELGEPLSLSDLQVALAALPSQEPAGRVLAAVGTDQNGDLWITGTTSEALERILGPSSEPSIPPEAGQGAEDVSTPAPANLSRSGAASNPTIVAGQDGNLRAFWWDQFEGLMISDGAVQTTSVLSGTEEIVTTVDSWSEPRPVPLPATTTPRIVADAGGRVHAFWLQQPTKEQLQAAAGKPQVSPLMYSQLASGAATWLPSTILAESASSFDVATDPYGAVHLAYITTVDSPSSPTGIYYRRTEEDGARWLASVELDQSRYFRLLSAETAHVRLAADDLGGVYVTWDDPHLKELVLAHSLDGGRGWETPAPLGDPEAQPQRGQLMAVPGGETQLVWEDTRSGGSCSLYQAPVADLLNGATVSGHRVFEELAACPDSAEFLSLGDGQVLMLTGSGTDSLTLVMWDGERWSESSRMSFSFGDPETGGQVYLGNLRAALEGESDKALVAVGTDQEGDVWASSSQTGRLDLVFAPPSPWSAPVSFVESEASINLPAIASDTEGRIHIIWSEEAESGVPKASLLYARRDEAVTSNGTEVRWTNPTEILASQDGGADQPALVAVDDRLHVVWRSGQEGEILYSQAFASDAYAASGWTDPQPLPTLAGMGSWPDIAVDLSGSLHVVYAVPVNEGRGIYYTGSNSGETWSEVRQVFDAAEAGWAMSDYPRIAVDLAGTIHAVWVRADPLGSSLTQAIYYAQSIDGGETWSAPVQVAEGAVAWPQVAASGTGQVHLLWAETAGEAAWWHQWSSDGGLTWTRPERVAGFANVSGPARVLADGSGTVHLVGLGYDESGEPALVYPAWDGQRWAEREQFRVDLAMDKPMPGVSAALLPALGQLDVVLRGESKNTGEGTQMHLWHTGRSVPAVIVTPVPASTPRPTPTSLPTSTPSILPTPTPSFGAVPPAASGSSMADLLPLLIPGGLAALLVAGAFGAGLLRAKRRR